MSTTNSNTDPFRSALANLNTAVETFLRDEAVTRCTSLLPTMTKLQKEEKRRYWKSAGGKESYKLAWLWTSRLLSAFNGEQANGPAYRFRQARSAANGSQAKTSQAEVTYSRAKKVYDEVYRPLEDLLTNLEETYPGIDDDLNAPIED